jgi:hypothetical protein
MIRKPVVFALAATALLAAGSVALADDEYRPSEFLGLDLPQAVLSPKRLGPPTEFVPVAVEAQTEDKTVTTSASDHASEPYLAREQPEIESRNVSVQDVQVKPPEHDAPKAVARLKPKGETRTKLAHRRGNPLNAQARDVRIQKWPCRSGGGICDWR